MRTIITTAATVEPVTLAEAKAQLRLDDLLTVDDDYISALISVARDRCENYCNQFFTEQGISLVYDVGFPSLLFLPYPGLTVNSITYTDENNAQQTLDSADYIVDSINQTITFLDDYTAINYKVNATTSVPVQIVGVQQAIKMILTDLYELRTETAVGVSLSDNPAVKALLYPYRLSLGI